MILVYSLRGILLPLTLLVVAETCWSKDIRYLNFSVKNRHDIYLRDLKAEEVSLRLDGKPVEVGFFGYKDVDTAFVVLLENSPRTAQYPASRPQWDQVNPLDRIRYEMYFGFFPEMTEAGSVLLGEFSQEIKILQDFTQYPDLLGKALNDLLPNYTEIGINDPEVGRAIGRGVDWLRDRPEKRKFLILFTTTVDRDSYGNLDEYRDMLREVDIELFVISYASNRPGSGRSFEEKMNRFFFKKLVAETAGWVYIVGAYVYLEELFTDFKGRLNNHYTIGFYVDPIDSPRDHEVLVEVEREKCKVAHRKVLIY
jgi:hypothetical protein